MLISVHPSSITGENLPKNQQKKKHKTLIIRQLQRGVAWKKKGVFFPLKIPPKNTPKKKILISAKKENQRRKSSTHQVRPTDRPSLATPEPAARSWGAAAPPPPCSLRSARPCPNGPGAAAARVPAFGCRHKPAYCRQQPAPYSGSAARANARAAPPLYINSKEFFNNQNFIINKTN